jgi:hypothetical protein
MKIFTFKNLYKLLEIALQDIQAWIFITVISPTSQTSSTSQTSKRQEISISDRIENLNQLKKWIDDGNDPDTFKFD